MATGPAARPPPGRKPLAVLLVELTISVVTIVNSYKKMADLPEERYSPSPAFTYVCLDLAAPIKVKAMTNKRAVLVLSMLS